MEWRRWDILLLIVVVLAFFWLRMDLADSAESLSYDSYLTVRSVDHIREYGVPLRDDDLSVANARHISNPIFEYVLAGAMVFSKNAYRIVPNLFMALLLLPLYFIALRFTRSIAASFVTIFLAGFGPIFFSSFLNTPSSTPVAAFLLVTVLALLHDIDKHISLIIFLTIALTFLSPVIFVLVLALAILVVLLRVEGYGVDKRIGELFLFTLILSLWFYIIIYKQAFFSQGVQVLWQNLPAEFAAITFGNATFLSTLYALGVVSFILGAVGMYQSLFEAKSRDAYPVVAGIISVVIALALRITPLVVGLVLLCVLLAVMAGHGLLVSVQYLRKTKFSWSPYVFYAILVILFILSAFLPSLVDAKKSLQEAPSAADVALFQTLGTRLSKDSVLLVPVKEGFAVQYFTKRTIVADPDFLLVQNGDELLRDIDSVYTSRFNALVIGKAQKLGFTHILFTRSAARQYARDHIVAEDATCLPGEHLDDQTILYTIGCTYAGDSK